MRNFTEVLDFWFHPDTKTKWFARDSAFDEKMRSQYLLLYWSASKSELFSWRESARGRLAEVVLLDQFARNMFRGSAQAFAADPLALALAQEAIRAGAQRELSSEERAFLYMPFMHSESLLIHDEALKLFAEPGLEGNLEYEHLHRNIIVRFGRYPHRNIALGRPSTEKELAFLQEKNSSF